MKRIKFIITALFAFSSLAGIAQVNQTVKDSDGRQLTQRREQSQPATGSMFINEKFMPAKLSNDDRTYMLRYNAYSDFFEMNSPQEETVKSLPKDSGIQITFVNNNETYAVVSYETEKGEQENGYLNVISDTPNVKIYKREKVILQPESFPTNSYQSYKAANYKRSDDEFYVKIKDGQAKFFDGKKELAKLVPGKDKEVLDFIKKNKLDLEKEADLVELANYMQTIL